LEGSTSRYSWQSSSRGVAVLRISELYHAWRHIVVGSYPLLSIEITRECPLRCPGCYAYEPQHLGQIGPLKSVADYKGQELIDGVINLASQHRPMHMSIIGGEPLVRFRELNTILPILSAMNIKVQVVTSAVRQIPVEWKDIKGVTIAVSIDGLQPEHDRRRFPATYEKILTNIVGHSVIVHCTVTSQMATRPDSFAQFLTFWSNKKEVKKIWFSLFTPQIGEKSDEILRPDDRTAVLTRLAALRPFFPKLDLPPEVIRGFAHPPQSPSECLFARSTLSITADLKGRITPCQFGGKPDCSQCGCMASAGLKAVGDYRVAGLIPLKSLYNASRSISKPLGKIRSLTN